MHAQENLYQKDRNFHVKPVFQESLYLTGIARGWAKYRDLLVASKSNYWQITILCDNRGQQLLYHSITQFVFIFKSLSDSSRKRSAIINVSPESVVFITHEQNIICRKTHLGCVPLGWSEFGSVIQDLSGSWCIKGPGESMTRVDSPGSLMHHDPDRSRQILDHWSELGLPQRNAP